MVKFNDLEGVKFDDLDLVKFNYLDLTKFQVQLKTYDKEEEDNSQEESAHPSPTIQYLKQTPERLHANRNLKFGLFPSHTKIETCNLALVEVT